MSEGTVVADDLEAWWRELGACALVGTARRPVPPLPQLGVRPRPDARPEVALLDSAAIGGSLRRAGWCPAHDRTAPEPAADDRVAVAPERAVQLLDLVLHQSPAGARHRDRLLDHWCRTATAHSRRAPHRLLPTLLDVATGSEELRAPVAAVADARGAWLAGHRPDWSWLAGADPVAADEDWALLPSAARLAALAGLRTTDPAAARELLLTTWATDRASDRRAHLETLRIGLGPEDEDLLESALDDRAASVREVAADLLDALPASRRADRMAVRLRPLVTTSGGRLRRQVEVALPDDPDADGVRDGLGAPPAGRSRRGWWLERIVAGAPFDVWEGSPEQVVHRVARNEDVLAGLRRAARARRDTAWARALLDRGFDAALVGVLPRRDREAAASARLEAAPESTAELSGVLAGLTTPWSPQFSAEVVHRLARAKQPGRLLGTLLPWLGAGLHPDALPALLAWRDRAALPSHTDDELGNLIQLHTLTRTITEAFR